jgi:hypothetical protein
MGIRMAFCCGTNPPGRTTMSIAESVFSALFERLVRAGVIVTADWATLRFFEEVPFSLVITLFVISGFAFIALERKESLKKRGLYSTTIVGLVLIYGAICGYAYETMPNVGGDTHDHSSVPVVIHDRPTVEAPSPSIPKSTRTAADIERINSRLSDLYDLINSEGEFGTDPDFDRTFADPHVILRLGGAVESRKRALAAKEKITKLGQDIGKFLSSYSHDAEILNSAIGNYQAAVYDFRNSMKEYAGSIPNQDLTADQLLNSDGLWGAHTDLMVRFEAFRKWRTDVLAPTGGIKRTEAALNQELQNAH